MFNRIVGPFGNPHTVSPLAPPRIPLHTSRAVANPSIDSPPEGNKLTELPPEGNKPAELPPETSSNGGFYSSKVEPARSPDTPFARSPEVASVHSSSSTPTPSTPVGNNPIPFSDVTPGVTSPEIKLTVVERSIKKTEIEIVETYVEIAITPQPSPEPKPAAPVRGISPMPAHRIEDISEPTLEEAALEETAPGAVSSSSHAGHETNYASQLRMRAEKIREKLNAQIKETEKTLEKANKTLEYANAFEKVEDEHPEYGQGTQVIAQGLLKQEEDAFLEKTAAKFDAAEGDKEVLVGQICDDAEHALLA
jgi:hypothetical protein